MMELHMIAGQMSNILWTLRADAQGRARREKLRCLL